MWNEMLHDDDIDSDLKDAIKHFFIPDNISFRKFMNNFLANKICKELHVGLSEFYFWKSQGLINENNVFIPIDTLKMLRGYGLHEYDTTISCTPTFAIRYSEGGIIEGTEFGDWFYIAYPDVVKWFEENLTTLQFDIRLEYGEYESGIVSIDLYRMIIDRYKEENISLECTDMLE